MHEDDEWAQKREKKSRSCHLSLTEYRKKARQTNEKKKRIKNNEKIGNETCESE